MCDFALRLILVHSQGHMQGVGADRRPVSNFLQIVTKLNDRIRQPAYARQTVDWYASVLGFHVTDWIAEEGCWMHVNPDHHVLALVQKGVNHVHHLAFELVDWGEMRVAFDHLAQNGRPLVWGPGRHGIARNLFSYFRMQEENLFVELFADLEQLPIDHEPRIYPDDTHTSNTWGRLPPRTYFRFDAEAIELERLGAQEMAPAPVL